MDFITLLDGIVVVVVLVSALLAMYRGFLREVLSIASWAAAAAVAVLFYKQAQPTVQVYIPNEQVALIATIAGLFLVTLLIVSWITMKVSDFVLDSAFGALDRTFGFLFGAARGLLLLVVAIQFFNGFVPAQQQPRWVAAAKSKPILDALGEELLAALPKNAEDLILRRLKTKTPDEGTPQEPGETRPPSNKSGEAPIYRNGEKKQLEQMIGNSGKAP
jgi:membrane protein required for colicin V production